MIHYTQSARISQKQDEHNIYAITKTISPPSYHHNGFVATYALGNMMYGYVLMYWVDMPSCSCAQVHELPRGDNREGIWFSFIDCIYVTPILLMYIYIHTFIYIHTHIIYIYIYIYLFIHILYIYGNHGENKLRVRFKQNISAIAFFCCFHYHITNVPYIYKYGRRTSAQETYVLRNIYIYIYMCVCVLSQCNMHSQSSP